MYLEPDDLFCYLKDDGKYYTINKEKHTASFKGCYYDVEELFIPRFVKFEFQEYPITTISKNSLPSDKYIRSIILPEDSELQTIECDAFKQDWGIQYDAINLFLPASVKIL